MKNLNTLLRDADPVSREPGLSADTVARVRHTVIAATHEAPVRQVLWGRQLAMAACLTVMVLTGVLVARRVPTAVREAPGASAASVTDQRTQVRFSLPAAPGSSGRWTRNFNSQKPGFGDSSMTMTTRSTFSAAAAIAVLLVGSRFTATTDAQQAATAGGQRGRSIQAATPSDMGLHGYSVVLVIGDMQAAGSADSVPSAARKALTDMQAFLPFKRYQLLDAAWMVCCGSYRSSISGRLRGPENGEYTYSIDTLNPTDDKKLTVRFMMRETVSGSIASAGASASGGGGRGGPRASSGSSVTENQPARMEMSRQIYEAIKERDETELVLRATKEKYTDVHPQAIEATARYNLAQRRLDELQNMSGGGGAGRGGTLNRSVMDSTFSIALGETVVIGTSRLKGDQALIALLTAAAKPGASR